MENSLNIYQGQESNIQPNAVAESLSNREVQEVQASLVIAKKFPRDEIQAFNRILRTCQRKSLAEKAMYEYPRGGQKVTGASIRLAESLAQNWGNIDFGIKELENKNGESQVMAYAWDLETNTRQVKIFSVPHIRYSKKKGREKLTDPRDIYEMVANQGARRLRACILGIIPSDVIEGAVEQCHLTLKAGNTEPLIDRVRKMGKAFEDKFSVTMQMLEEYLGCSCEAFSENDFVRLRNVYSSLRDGMAKREDYFNIPKSRTQRAIDDVPTTFNKEIKEHVDIKVEETEKVDLEGSPFGESEGK